MISTIIGILVKLLAALRKQFQLEGAEQERKRQEVTDKIDRLKETIDEYSPVDYNVRLKALEERKKKLGL